MSKRSKYSIEQKIMVCEAYINNGVSAKELARSLGMTEHGDDIIFQWAKLYCAYGKDAFTNYSKNRMYSKEFKERVVRDYLDGNGTILDLQIKYRIPSNSTISAWVNKYTKGEEIHSYCPYPEVYKVKAKRDTTLEERIEIVNYFLNHNRNYKETIRLFGCSYNQVRNWILKYENECLDKYRKNMTQSETELNDGVVCKQ